MRMIALLLVEWNFINGIAQTLIAGNKWNACPHRINIRSLSTVYLSLTLGTSSWLVCPGTAAPVILRV